LGHRRGQEEYRYRSSSQRSPALYPYFADTSEISTSLARLCGRSSSLQAQLGSRRQVLRPCLSPLSSLRCACSASTLKLPSCPPLFCRAVSTKARETNDVSWCWCRQAVQQPTGTPRGFVTNASLTALAGTRNQSKAVRLKEEGEGEKTGKRRFRRYCPLPTTLRSVFDPPQQQRSSSESLDASSRRKRRC
jgi:hypothetical protein